jgi:hypothetical protein
MTNRKQEPTLEISMTMTELMAVVKSLSIGVDQLAKKIQRLGDGKRADATHEELTALLSAKQEMEDVLSAALGGNPWE